MEELQTGFEPYAEEDPAVKNSERINALYGEIAKHRNYLNDTDYMTLREREGGEAMPEEVKAERAKARIFINAIESHVKALEKGEEPGELDVSKEVEAANESLFAETVKAKVLKLVAQEHAQDSINAYGLTPKEALAVKGMYPAWVVGLAVKTGERYLYENELWEVRQPHTTQENWKPGLATASLWAHVDEEHGGTKEDPIPYNPPMQIYNGKYYTQGGVLYLCNRDSGQPLTHDLSALAGLYVKKV